MWDAEKKNVEGKLVRENRKVNSEENFERKIGK